MCVLGELGIHLLLGMKNRSPKIMEWKNLDGHSVNLSCFTLVFLRDLKNPNYNDSNCLKFMFSDMAEFISPSSPPNPLTIADLPFAEKDEFRLSVLSWFLCSSQIINDLLVFAIIEEILTLLNILNRFGEVSG